MMDTRYAKLAFLEFKYQKEKTKENEMAYKNELIRSRV